MWTGNASAGAKLCQMVYQLLLIVKKKRNEKCCYVFYPVYRNKPFADQPKSDPKQMWSAPSASKPDFITGT